MGRNAAVATGQQKQMDSDEPYEAHMVVVAVVVDNWRWQKG